MAGQKISLGNIFGRVGSGIGQGLAEQVPKEIERNRLSSGLKELGERKNQTPFQQFSGLVGAAHEYPQVIQSGAELLKQQGIRNSFTRNANPSQINPQIQLENVKFANKQPEAQQQIKNEHIFNPENFGGTPIQPNNEIRVETLPAIPASPKQRLEEIAELQNNFPDLPLNDILSMWEKNEASRLAQPEAHRAQDEYLTQKRKELNDNFTNQLEELTQKKGSEVYKDVSGESLGNIKESMNRELASNPNATINEVARKWANRALEFAKTKNNLKKLADSSIFATPILLDKPEYRNKLLSAKKSYDDAGLTEEYYNTLQSDFNLSPQGAASLAYPISDSAQKVISGYEPLPSIHFIANPKSGESAQKLAENLRGKLTANDSIGSIVRHLQQKDAFFNQSYFYQKLKQMEDELSLTARQRREITDGAQKLPSWGDVLILPFFRGL